MIRKAAAILRCSYLSWTSPLVFRFNGGDLAALKSKKFEERFAAGSEHPRSKLS